MTEKELAFELKIRGLSNEAVELEKVHTYIKNVKDEIRDLNKEIAKQGGLGSTEQNLKMATLNKLLGEHTAKEKELTAAVRGAEGSLIRLRAEYSKLKATYDSVDEATRVKMIPGMNKLNDKIVSAERAVGMHQRNVGNYPTLMGNVGGAFQEFGTKIADSFRNLISAAGISALLTASLAKLKQAFESTTFGMDAFNIIGQVTKQVFYDLATSMQINTQNVKESIQVAKEMNKIRQGDLIDLVKIADLENDVKDLRLKSVDVTKSEAEQLEYLNRAIAKEDELIKYRIDDAKEELESIKKALKLRPEDYNLQLAYAQKIAELRNIVSDKNIRLAARESALEKKELETREKNWQAYLDEIERMNAEADKKAEAARQKKVDDEKKYLEDLKEANAKYWETLVNKEVNITDFISEIHKVSGLKDNVFKVQENKKWLDQMQKDQDESNRRELETGADKEERKRRMIEAAFQGVQMGADAAFANKKARLQAEMEAELSNVNLTEQQKTAIKKKYAKEQQQMDVKQAIISGALAIGNALATTKPFIPAAIIAAALAALQTGLQIATIKAQTFASGGYTGAGGKYQPAGVVHAGEWVAPQEIVKSPVTGPVISRLERARLNMMGTGMIRNSGQGSRYGYAEGGYVIPPPTAVPNIGIDYDRLAMAIKGNLKVVNDINKVKAALDELEMINEHQRI